MDMVQDVRSVVKLLALGIFAWVVAGVVALTLNADTKILWTCLSGALLGVVGTLYTVRRARKSGI